MVFWLGSIRGTDSFKLVEANTWLQVRPLDQGRWELTGKILTQGGKPLIKDAVVFDHHTKPIHLLDDGAFIQLDPLPEGVLRADHAPPTGSSDFNIYVRAFGPNGELEFEIASNGIYSKTGLKIEPNAPDSSGGQT